MNHAEDRDVHADPEREDKHHGCRAPAAQPAHGVASVLATFVDEPLPASGAELFFQALLAAKLQSRLPPRIFDGHALLHEIIGVGVDVEL